MRRMIGYLPELEQPFEVELVAASVAADVALLRCQIAKALPPLELAEAAPRPGDDVIVLGYPAGPSNSITSSVDSTSSAPS